MKDNTSLIIIIGLIGFIVYCVYNKQTTENYSNIPFTNYQQIKNYAKFPNSIADAYILNYQYVYPGPVVGMKDSGTCKTY